MTGDRAATLLDLQPAAASDAVLLAGLHAACFAGQEPWSAAAMARLLALPGVSALIATARVGADRPSAPAGFVMLRVVVEEAEIITICVVPQWRGQGVGRRLLDAAMSAAARAGARTMHLEVSADNAPAAGLYEAAGFVESGRRPSYYRRRNAPAVDARVLSCPLSPAAANIDSDKI